MPDCHADDPAPNAIKPEDGTPYRGFERGSLAQIDVQDTYDDLSTDTTRSCDLPGGAEVFVISGNLSEGGDTLGPWDWLRLPPGSLLLLGRTARASGSKPTIWERLFRRAPPKDAGD